MKIAIMCELKGRELQFLTILKKKLEIDSHEVKLIPQRVLVGKKIRKFKPHLIIVNGLRSDSSYIEQIYEPKKMFNCYVISLYSEQIGQIDDRLVRTYDNPKILQSVDAHIVWGNGFAEGLLELGVDSSKIWVLGSMALDLPFFIKEKTEAKRESIAKHYGLDSEKKWILISDNIIRRVDQVEIYDEIRANFNEKLKTIAEHINNAEFIFRPHPDNRVEDLDKIISDFENNDNIKVIGEEHNLLWTLLAKAMIVWRSTSSIEALSAKKEVFALQTDDNKFDYFHKEFIPNFKNADDLKEALSSYLKGNYKVDEKYVKARNQYLEKWFFQIDGKSCDRICYLVNELISHQQTVPLHSSVNKKDVLNNRFLELKNVVAKKMKGEYDKFYLKEKDLIEAERNISQIESNFTNFEIVNGEIANYLIDKKD